MRTRFKEKNQEEPAPQWLEVEDVMMEDRMSKDEAKWRVQEWLEELIRPQDSVSVREEPMESML